MGTRVCAAYRCPRIIESPDRYCAEHAPAGPPRRRPWKDSADARRPHRSRRGYGAKWIAFRKRYLAAHPLCVVCSRTATEVHHRDGLGPNGPLGYDERNLEALCKSCHSRKTARRNGR